MSGLSRLVAAPGAHSVPYIDPAFPDRPLLLHSARPRRFDGDTPVLIVHHGVGRNGRDYRDYWMPLVDAAGILVISIEFTEQAFPDYLWYHFGNLHDEKGGPNPREQWTYGIDERLFTALCDQGLTRRQRYGLFGHSAGGQFVHRMLSFGFRDRVAVAVSANAGTYAMPDLEIAWPFGLGETELDADDAASIAGVPDHRDDRHARHQDDRPVLPEGSAFDAPGRDTARARAQLCAGRARGGRGTGHALRLDGDQRARCRPRRRAHVGCRGTGGGRGAACRRA